MTLKGQPETSKPNRARDFVLYGAISLGFMAVLLFAAHRKVSPDAYTKWGGLTFFTAILFGNFITQSRQFFRSRPFWVLAGSLLTVHLAAFVILLVRASEWRGPWFLVMLLEVPLFNRLRDRIEHPM
jgi:drug/metabolite transporter superfamily protein YnfA